MNAGSKILITGAGGFIGSSMVTALNEKGYRHLILSDNFNKPDKDKYLKGKFFDRRIPAEKLLEFMDSNGDSLDFVFHLGGKTSDKSDFHNQNVIYPQELFRRCFVRKIPFVYASSSSVYGNGDEGYSDDEATTRKLQATNDYGKSKLEFDRWMIKNGNASPWIGLRIFNVYGPNEYHKGMSASVAFKTYFEIMEKKSVSLFGSANPEFADGSQQRDFIYVKDVTKVLMWFLEQRQGDNSSFQRSGIYNLGTAVGSSFNEVAQAVFEAMNLPVHIRYIPMPKKVADHYRDKIVGESAKLRAAGFVEKFTSLQHGVSDLVRNYLMKKKYL